MPKIHFQSIYRYCGLTVAEPLCRLDGGIREGQISPLKHEVTCEVCLRFLIELKEQSHA